MRGYVENLEREHFNHPDHCGCECEPVNRPGFDEFVRKQELQMEGIYEIVMTKPICFSDIDIKLHNMGFGNQQVDIVNVQDLGNSKRIQFKVLCQYPLDCLCQLCDPDGKPHGKECECDTCCDWHARQKEIDAQFSA